MARRGRVCVATECERRAEPGSMVCADHRWTALGAETDREIVQLTRRFEAMSRMEDGEKRRETAAAFIRQVKQGKYQALQSAQMLDDSGNESDLTREIGMLRTAMLRVLTEEEHPSRMGHALAKLSFALGRAVNQENEMKGKRELTETERWEVALGQLFPPLQGSDDSEEERARRQRREAVMAEVWQVMDRYDAEEAALGYDRRGIPAEVGDGEDWD